MSAGTAPLVGDRAPDFTLRDQHGAAWSLSERSGPVGVALVFFPFAFSPVCSAELRDLCDLPPRLADTGVTLAAISCDSMYSLRAHAEQEGIDLPLLSDFWPHGAVAEQYGVLDRERGHPTRSTFVIDSNGVVRWTVHNPPGEARPAKDLLAAVDAVLRA